MRPRIASTPRTVSGLAALLAFASLACRTPSSKLPLEQLRADDPANPAQGEARETVAPLPVETPSDLLPPEVPVLAEARDPAAVLAMLGPLDQIPELAAVRAELRGQLGGDPLDPGGWAQLGLDVHAPAGFGVLELAGEGLFAYVSLVDEDRFATTVERFADMVGKREELGVSEVGGARIYRLDRDVSIVVRERVAVLVFVDEPDRAGRDHVVSVATLDPRESLGHSEAFAWARAQLVDADDGMIFVNPPVLLPQIDRLDGEQSDYGIRYAEEELARARAAGEPPERIRELEARVADERTWQREREQRDAGERELRDALIGSVTRFVAAADLRADGIVAHARAQMPASNLLGRLFVAPEHESPLLTALDHRPLAVIDGRLDLDVLVELLELLARAEGESLTSLASELRSELGVDVLGELLPALRGDGGLALVQTGKPDPSRLGEVARTLGLAGHVGLRDPALIRRALDGIARTKAMGGALTRAKRGDGWTLRIPDWRALELAVVGERLVLSSEPGFARRVRDGERGALAEELAAPEHPLRGLSPSPVQRLYWRWLALVLAEADEPWPQAAESFMYGLDEHPALTPEQAAKVPKSKDYKRKRAELDAAVEALEAFNRRRARARFEAGVNLTEALGDVGFTLARVDDGLAVAGRWRFAPGTTPAALGAQMYALDRGDDWAEYDRLHTEIYRLVDDLRQIRQAELDAAATAAR